MKGVTGHRGPLLVIALCVALAASVAAVYWPAAAYDFIVYDDGEHVFENPMVKNGLTREGVSRAFRSFYAAYWIPLTWLSFMLDAELFGMNPGGFHVTNVILHAANAVLLFLVLWRMTGALWRSAAAAALFALHPLRVESVAWITERKDVLSTFFLLLAMASYLRYTRLGRIKWYAAVIACAALGMMAKPMLVTLPFVLLLCDWWPLGRAQGGEGRKALSWGRLLLEKVPLLALSTAFILLVLHSKKEASALLPFEENFLQVRLTLFFSSSIIYLKKFFWPTDLILEGRPLSLIVPWKATLAALTWTGLSLLSLWKARRMPWLAVGWFWYVVTLTPVSGLVGVGETWLGDRFTYVPQIGIAIALVWLLADALRRWRHGPAAAAVGAAALFLCLSVLSRRQLAHWSDSHAVLAHALEVSQSNYVAHRLLGAILLDEGRVDEALGHFRRNAELRPYDAFARMQLGEALERKGSFEEALSAFRSAVALAPSLSHAHLRLGMALAQRGEYDGAEESFREALRLSDDSALVRYNYAVALILQGRDDEALENLEEAIRLDPFDEGSLFAAGQVLLKTGKAAEASERFREVLRLSPGNARAHYYLGRGLQAEGRWADAAGHYREAIRLDPERGGALLPSLGAALVEAGEIGEAAGVLEEALRLSPVSPLASCYLGRVYERRGDSIGAGALYRKAIDAGRDIPEIGPDLERCLAGAGIRMKGITPAGRD